MDIVLRTFAILIETVILTAVLGCFLFAAWLTVFDLGLGQRYAKMLKLVLVIAGVIVVVFFIGHLAAFYPDVGI